MNMNNNSKINYTPLKIKLNMKLLYLATLDIETFEDFDSKEQLPLCITACLPLANNNVNKIKLATISVKLDIKLYNSSVENREKAISLFWITFWETINKICLRENINKLTFMVHNLGKFDGQFLIKGLLYVIDYKLVETLIDNNHSIIIFTGILNNVKITLKNSYRIFPVSLN